MFHFFAIAAFAGSTHEKIFNEDMLTVLRSLDPGYSLAKSYRAYNNVDDKVMGLSGSYLMQPLVIAEENGEKRKLIAGGKTNERLLPAPSAGHLGDSFAGLTARANGFTVTIRGDQPGNWERKLTFVNLKLAAETTLTADAKTLSWVQTTKNYVTGAVTTTSGGFNDHGRELPEKSAQSKEPLKPLQDFEAVK